MGMARPHSHTSCFRINIPFSGFVLSNCYYGIIRFMKHLLRSAYVHKNILFIIREHFRNMNKKIEIDCRKITLVESNSY